MWIGTELVKNRTNQVNVLVILNQIKTRFHGRLWFIEFETEIDGANLILN